MSHRSVLWTAPLLVALSLGGCRRPPPQTDLHASPTSTAAPKPRYDWSRYGSQVLEPGTVVNREAHEIRLSFLVLGGESAFLAYVHARTSDGGSPMISTARDDAPHIDFLPLVLGQIRDYRPHIYLYGFDLHPRTDLDCIEDTAEHASGLIVVRGGQDEARLSAAREPARISPRTPYAVLGDKALIDAWTKRMGGPPAFAREVEASQIAAGVGVFDALKAVTKEALKNLR